MRLPGAASSSLALCPSPPPPSQTSFVRSASEPVQLTLQGLQAQLNDVVIAVAAARALAAANNASVLKALEKPNAWIKAATAQLVAANVRSHSHPLAAPVVRRHATTRPPPPPRLVFSAGDCAGL